MNFLLRSWVKTPPKAEIRIIELSDYLSIFASIITVIAAYAVIGAYGTVWFPRRKDGHSWFAHGICVGFFAIAANAVYWGLLLRGFRIGHWEAAVLVAALGPYVDLVIKGALPAWAAYAHLKAKHLALSAAERRAWSVWEMVHYPVRRSLICKWLRRSGPSVERHSADLRRDR